MAEELIEISYSFNDLSIKKKTGGWYNEAWGPIDDNSGRGKSLKR